jgi:hypothetical protein
MKILKKGEIPEQDRYPKKKTCGYCKTEFEYDKSDIKGDSRDGDYVICPHPECKKFLNVSPERTFAGRT